MLGSPNENHVASETLAAQRAIHEIMAADVRTERKRQALIVLHRQLDEAVRKTLPESDRIPQY